MKRLPQRRFSKGVVAGTSDFAQPANAVPRSSNLVLTRRGSLVTVDGSKIISALNGAVQTGQAGPWLSLFLLKVTATSNTYLGVKRDPATHVAAPAGLAAALGAAGLLNSTYTWAITSVDGAGGESLIAAGTATATPVNQQVGLTWTGVPLATSYNLYRTKAGVPGVYYLVANIPFGTNAYTDNIPDASLGAQQPPTTDTTQVTQWYVIPATSYGVGNILLTMPAANLVNLNTTPGGVGGGGTGTGSGTGSGLGSPSGGLPHALCPIPQLLQFLDLAILCPGNGFAPQQYNPTLPVSGGNPTALTNTFSPIYAAWEANTVFTAGNIVVPTPDNGHFYTCIQGGVSGNIQPTFATGTKSKTQDHSCLWQEAGSTAATSPPRGAAHGVVHLGCLWVANTYPTNTADGLDGPCALRQSDVNNQNSWNPVNVAFLGKDDGTQIMGLTPFTIGEFGIAPTPSLVVFKDFATYQVIGLFGASNFSIQLAQTDMGCVAPRTIVFIPGFGVARLAHLGIAIFDGVKDRLISEDIRPYIFTDQGSVSDIQGIDWSFAYFSKAAQTVDPPMYVMAVPVGASLFTYGLTGVNLQAAGATGVWPVGNVYVVVQAYDGLGNVYKSAEQIVNLAANQYLELASLTEPPNCSKIRIYYGFAPGQENLYVDFFPRPVFFGGHIVGYFFQYPLVIQHSTDGLVGSPTVSQGALGRILCFDLIAKAWTIVDLPWPISAMTQIRAQGTEPLTIIGAFSDGTVRRWQANDLDWDGTPITWSVRSPEVFEKAATQRMYFRKVLVRGTFQSATTVATLQIKVTVNGVDGAIYNMISYQSAFGSGQFQMEFPIHVTGLNAHATISGNSPAEIEAFEWDVMPKPVVATPSI